MDATTFFTACTGTPEIFARLIPSTDDIRDIAKLCLVNKTFRDFLFSTIPGRSVWLKTASTLTGYDGFKVIDIRVSDFQYQLKLLVCPWLSKSTPLLFEYPDSMGLCERNIRLINNSRILFRMKPDEDVGDDDDIAHTYSFASAPCRTESEFKKTLVELPFNFPDCRETLLGDDLSTKVSDGDIIPILGDSTTMCGKYIHKTAFAVMESISYFPGPGLIDGSVYFMSMRDEQNPRMLRHISVQGIESYGIVDIIAAPQKIWLMNSDCISYFGPQIERGLMGGVTSSMTPAVWMAAGGNAAGAIKHIKDATGLHINTPSLLGGRSLLHYAAYMDRPAAVAELVEAGANVNQKDDEHVTPLMLAVCRLNHECVRALCQRGADPNVRDKKGMTAILHTGSEGTLKGSTVIIDIMGTLIAAGANPNDTDPGGKTVLFYTDIFTRMDVFRFMLTKGADPRHIDDNGNTLLHFCLVKTGSNPIVIPEMAGLLVRALGVDVNAQNKSGVTALFMNVFNLTPDEIRFMVEELRADITIKSNNGKTVYQKHTMNGVPKTTWPPVLDKFMEICSILKC